MAAPDQSAPAPPAWIPPAPPPAGRPRPVPLPGPAAGPGGCASALSSSWAAPGLGGSGERAPSARPASRPAGRWPDAELGSSGQELGGAGSPRRLAERHKRTPPSPQEASPAARRCSPKGGEAPSSPRFFPHLTPPSGHIAHSPPPRCGHRPLPRRCWLPALSCHPFGVFDISIEDAFNSLVLGFQDAQLCPGAPPPSVVSWTFPSPHTESAPKPQFRDSCVPPFLQ